MIEKIEKNNFTHPEDQEKIEEEINKSKEEIKKLELSFYSAAFTDNSSRRERKFSWEKNPSKTVIELVEKNDLDKDTSKKRVLDLGCGDGRNSEYFLSLGYEVIGVDFCQEAVDICKNKFKDERADFYVLDLTEVEVLKKLGKFDLVIDWSVLDHIRPQYINDYLNNINDILKDEGHLFLSEFSESLPGISKDKEYKIVDGHYSKAYSVEELKKMFPQLDLIDLREDVLEDEINNYRFHTLLMKNKGKEEVGE